MAIYGWRARIGMILPEVATCAEQEMAKLLPDGVAIYTARTYGMPKGMQYELDDQGRVHSLCLWIKDSTRQDRYDRFGHLIEKLGRTAPLLATQSDIILYQCSGLSWLEGVGYDERMIKTIEEGATLPDITRTIPAITSATALYKAMKKLEIKKIVMVNPYHWAENAEGVEFLEGHGFEVINVKACGLNHDQHLMTTWEPGDWYRVAKSVWMPEADGIVIPCANIRNVDIIQALEDDTNTVVFTAYNSSLWGCLDKLGIRLSIQGYGKLLREGLMS